MKKIIIILVSLFFTGILFSQNDNKALKVSDIKGTYEGHLQKLTGGQKNDTQWKAIINEDMTFSLRAKDGGLWIEQMRTDLTRKRFYEKKGSVYYEFTPKGKNDNVKSISFTILSAHYKKVGHYKGLLLIISLTEGGHLIFDVNRAGGNPTIPAAVSKQSNTSADVTIEELDLATKSFAIYEELTKMDFEGINKIYSYVVKNQKSLSIQQAKAKFRPVLNKFKSIEENARKAEKLTQTVIATAGKYGCEKKEIEYIRAAKHLRDLLSNLQMAEDRMYVAVNNASEPMTIEFFDKSNDSYNDAKGNLKAFFKAERIAVKTKCVEKITASTRTNSNTKPRSKPKVSKNSKPKSNTKPQVAKTETILRKPKGSISNPKHTASHINSLFVEKGDYTYTLKDQKKYPTPNSFPTFEGSYEGNDLFGLLGRHIEDPAVIGFINYYRMKKVGSNQYFKFKSSKQGLLVKFEKNTIKSIKLKMNGAAGDGNYIRKLPFGVLRSDNKAQIKAKLPSGTYMMLSWADFKIDDFMGTIQIPKENEYWYVYLTFDNGF